MLTAFRGVPDPWRAGGPLTHWALIGALLDAGHDVAFVGLPSEVHPREERLAALVDRGAQITLLAPPAPPRVRPGRWRARARYLRSVAWPDDGTLFPGVLSASALERTVADVAPDVLVAHGNSAIAAAAGVARPKLAVFGDPPGVSRRLRTRWAPQYAWRLGRDELLYRLGSAMFALRADRRFAQILRGFDSVATMDAHRVEWAGRRGIRAWHTTSPIVDSAGPRWRERRAAARRNARPRILMIGHLQGIATISGLHVLVRHVLPELTRALGPDGFELHIVGDHEPPGSLRRALDHPAVRLRGQVEPPDEEFLRADVLLVPTPIETGPHIRILVGMSFGCCVVAHDANRLGIPELEDGVNCLLADSGSLARATVRALADPGLRERLGAAGRHLYEARFTPAQASAQIIAELERIAHT